MPSVNPYGTTYQTVAAGQTAAQLGSGVAGGVIGNLTIIPATVAPGLVTLIDGVTSITVFVGGTTDLKPFTITLGWASRSAGGWKVTTGANVSVVAQGTFL